MSAFERQRGDPDSSTFQSIGANQSRISGSQAEVDMELLTAHLLSTHSKLAGLELFSQYLGSGNSLMQLMERQNQQGVPYMAAVFKGLRGCLTVQENEVDVLLKTNQLLYDIMAEIHKNPNELQPEVAALIPWFIENLGNPKATVRKTTHKCIGTFVKFSRKLEYVLLQLIRVGLANQNQRTRQHSMLVIPALLSLKPQLVEDGASELHQLVQNVCAKLRDPTEIVAKTARKLLLELKKCYPDTFESTFVASIGNSEDKQICQLILDNQIEKANEIISNTQPSKRMVPASTVQLQQTQVPPVQNKTPLIGANKSTNLGVIGQSQPLNQSGNQFQARGLAQPSEQSERNSQSLASNQSTISSRVPPAVSSSLNTTQNTNNSASKSPALNFKQHMQIQQKQHQQAHSTASDTSQMNSSQQNNEARSANTPLLSVVGREIIQTNKASTKEMLALNNNNNSRQEAITGGAVPENGQTKDQIIVNLSPRQQNSVLSPPKNSSSMSVATANSIKKDNSMKEIKFKNTTQWPMDMTTGLLFGFLEPELVQSLDENQPWKERTQSMDLIESHSDQLIRSEKVNSPIRVKFCEQYAWDFLGFVSKFVTDINFKISLAAIKIVHILFAEQPNKPSVVRPQDISPGELLANSPAYKKHFKQLVGSLIEKLGDSKQVIRESTLMACCSLVGNAISAQLFVQHANLKNLQHANQYAKENILNVLAKGFILQEGHAGSTNLATSQYLIEELCFLAKVEERKKLQMMVVDVLALATVKSNNPQRTEQMIHKEIKIKSETAQQPEELQTKIKLRQEQQWLPKLARDGTVEFNMKELPAPKQPVSIEDPRASQQRTNQFEKSAPIVIEKPTEGFAVSGPMHSQMQHQPPNSAQHNPLKGQGKHAEMLNAQNNNQSFQQNLTLTQQINPKQVQSQGQEISAELKSISSLAPQIKTPSMSFMENKRKEETKSLQDRGNVTQQFPQSAGVTTSKAGLTGTQPPGSSDNAFAQHQLYQQQLASQNVGGGSVSGQYQARVASSPNRAILPVDSQSNEKVAMWLPSFTPQAGDPGAVLRTNSFGSQDHNLPSHNLRTNKDSGSSMSNMTMGSQGFQTPAPGVGPALAAQQHQQHINLQKQQAALQAQANGATPPAHRQGINATNKTQRNQSQHNGGPLNATASSSATFVDDGRSFLTNTTQVSSAHKEHVRANSNTGGVPNAGLFSETNTNKTTSDFHNNNNYRQAFGQSQNSISGVSQPNTHMGGYVPEPHLGKPRSIQSNQDKQRQFNQSAATPGQNNQNMSQGSNGSGFQERPQLNDRLQLLKSTYKYKTKFDGTQEDEQGNPVTFDQNGQPILQSHTLDDASQYTRKSGPVKAAYLKGQAEESKSLGSKKNSNVGPTQVQLKQRQNSSSAGKPPVSQQQDPFGQRRVPGQNPDDRGMSPLNPTIQHSDPFGQARKPGQNPDERGMRPLNPAAVNNDAYGSTTSNKMLHTEKKMLEQPSAYARMTSNQNSSGAPPLAPNVYSQSEAKTYADKPSKVQNEGQLAAYMQDGGANKGYDEANEPFNNPDQALKKAVEDLKSSDWSRNFDACNTLKRIAKFHKNLHSLMAPQIFKAMIQPIDSLRSQVSKNATLTVSTLYNELPSKDIDPFTETCMPVLLKRAADTNQFISEQAKNALASLIQNCSENKVFAALQNQNLKNNAIKEQVLFCYSVLAEKLGSRFKSFREVERFVQTVVAFLDQGAQEVRQQAKLAILTIQSVSGGPGREFDGLLLKCRLNENQKERIRKVVQQEDFESLSNYAQTRYGASMRASPLVSQNTRPVQHTQYGMLPSSNTPNVGGSGFTQGNIGNHLQSQTSGNETVSGSEGFSYPRRNMESTFMSGGAFGSDAGGNVPINQQISIGDNSSAFNDHRSSGSNQMQYLKHPSGPQSHQALSTGFHGATSTQQTFKKRTTSVSKPVDRQIMEDFKTILDTCQTQDWQKRMKAIDALQEFTEQNAGIIKNSSPSNFVQLIDAYSRFLQDPNTKVLAKAQQSFEVLLTVPELGALFNSNLSIVVQALTQNLCSTAPAVRNKGEGLLDLLEEVVVAESRGNANNLLLPIVSQLAQTNTNRAKPALVERLCNLVDRVDKMALIDRHLGGLLQPKHKIHTEANGNVQLKQALARLEIAVQNVGQY